MRIKHFIIPVLMLVFVVLFADTSLAQCAMCKASAESSVEAGSQTLAGINKGILYLLIMPYIAVGSLLVAIWYNRRKAKANGVSIN